MGLRFRKSIKVAPGVKLNVGKKSAGISVGTKGARYSVSSSGRRTSTVGIPGTGLSYQNISTKKKKTVNKSVEYVDTYDDFDEEIEYEAEFTPKPEPEVSGAALTNLKTRRMVVTVLFVVLAVIFSALALIPVGILCIVGAVWSWRNYSSQVRTMEARLKAKTEQTE